TALTYEPHERGERAGAKAVRRELDGIDAAVAEPLEQRAVARTGHDRLPASRPQPAGDGEHVLRPAAGLRGHHQLEHGPGRSVRRQRRDHWRGRRRSDGAIIGGHAAACAAAARGSRPPASVAARTPGTRADSRRRGRPSSARAPRLVAAPYRAPPTHAPAAAAARPVPPTGWRAASRPPTASTDRSL